MWCGLELEVRILRDKHLCSSSSTELEAIVELAKAGAKVKHLRSYSMHIKMLCVDNSNCWSGSGNFGEAGGQVEVGKSAETPKHFNCAAGDGWRSLATSLAFDAEKSPGDEGGRLCSAARRQSSVTLWCGAGNGGLLGLAAL
ncbi:hypothetical protein PF001_g2127 [Phytophthora fragariae]|uniref:Uncharacterized protein n=1 Tax=Phytophthora fragariae TaxID=53985 RepID=A0A6A4ETI8_9STRA|nr:hypothetical protein PF001_g2127 [Phytophthora fragariae]